MDLRKLVQSQDAITAGPRCMDQPIALAAAAHSGLGCRGRQPINSQKCCGNSMIRDIAMAVGNSMSFDAVMFTRTPHWPTSASQLRIYASISICRGELHLHLGGTPFSISWDSSVAFRATQDRQVPLCNKRYIYIYPRGGGIPSSYDSAGKPLAGTPFPNQGIVPTAVKRHRFARKGRAPTLGSPDGALCGVMSVWGPGEGGEYRAPPICETPKHWWQVQAKWPGGGGQP